MTKETAKRLTELDLCYHPESLSIETLLEETKKLTDELEFNLALRCDDEGVWWAAAIHPEEEFEAHAFCSSKQPDEALALLWIKLKEGE